MRWHDDLPEDWEEAPDDPPRAEAATRTVELKHGLSILSDEEVRAWIYADDDAVESVRSP